MQSNGQRGGQSGRFNAKQIDQAGNAVFSRTLNAKIDFLCATGQFSWTRRCWLEPFKRLASTLTAYLPGIVRGMLDGRSNAYVEAMNGLLQQTKTAARGFRTVSNFVAIAYLRMGKLTRLLKSLFALAVSRGHGVTRYRDRRQVSLDAA
ncbi:MAG: transposase [Burkholderiaceae bacterium]